MLVVKFKGFFFPCLSIRKLKILGWCKLSQLLTPNQSVFFLYETKTDHHCSIDIFNYKIHLLQLKYLFLSNIIIL